MFPSLYRYRGYHDNTYPYGYSRTYWHLLAARLAFVFVFQFVVYSITGFIAWLVPDRPDELEFKVEREKQVIKSVFYDSDDYSDLEEEDDEDDDTVVFEDAKQEFDAWNMKELCQTVFKFRSFRNVVDIIYKNACFNFSYKLSGEMNLLVVVSASSGLDRPMVECFVCFILLVAVFDCAIDRYKMSE